MARSYIVPRRVLLKKNEKWTPKKWKPVYEEIVLLSAAGKSNEEIAKVAGYTPQQISNILNAPQAKLALEEIGVRAREKFGESFYDRIERLSQRSLDNMEKVLTKDEWLDAAPIAMFDRSLNFMKAAGKLTGDSPKEARTTNIIIGAEVQRTLLEGLQKANRVIEIHSSLNEKGKGSLPQLPPPERSA